MDDVTIRLAANRATKAAPAEWFTGSVLQDAFATPGAHPTLGPNEIAALNVIGYNLKVTVVPEPAAVLLLGTGMLVASGFGLRYRRPRAGHRAA